MKILVLVTRDPQFGLVTTVHKDRAEVLKALRETYDPEGNCGYAGDDVDELVSELEDWFDEPITVDVSEHEL